MPGTTTKGIPYPVAADNNNNDVDMTAIANGADSRFVQSFTSVQIAALSAAEKWNGRVVYDSTLGLWLEYISGAWRAKVGERVLWLTAAGPLSCAGGGNTSVTRSTEVLDYEGIIAVSSSVLTFPRAGWFAFSLTCVTDGGGGGVTTGQESLNHTYTTPAGKTLAYNKDYIPGVNGNLRFNAVQYMSASDSFAVKIGNASGTTYSMTTLAFAATRLSSV